ncbi:MobA/MobL family protein [Microvirga guangxiensis]|uniref:MobA/MobL family protein n=1 Tax=Microvirga guangxiensis TaxID=549386 RepID=A0A1G5KFN6_9HYPH|nr:MobA/MobL family protein [Microvirga guangxiensis]SCY98779.1 MobA/MobL family protein [Microvirga guangxiensis]
MTQDEAEEIVRRDLARGLSIAGRIAEAERRALERLERRSSSPRNFAALVEAFHSPGLRTARDFNQSSAFKTAPRPEAPDTGGVTFHFSVTSVSKSNRIVAAYAGRAPSGSADQHGSYIERDGAAEAFVDPESMSFGQEEAAGGQAYIERVSASERVDEKDAIIVSSFGNIADTKEERLEFWKKLEKVEQSARGHKFTINPFRGADFWNAVREHLAAGKDVPAPLAQALQHCLTDVAPFDVTLRDEDAISLLKFAHSIGDFETDGAIKVSLGRGGRVQTRIIAELPHEVTPAQRLELVKEYCAEFDRLGLPYWAVIHAPDKHNDRRNFHVHIALSERPAKRMVHPATGETVWDFEIVETYKTARRQTRHRHPFIQKRNREVHHSSWISAERRRYSKILNDHLEQAGISKRYDHRSYKAMGLSQKAKERIDPKIYAKERKGQMTEQGLEAARQQWTAAVDDLHRECREAAELVVRASYANRVFLHTLHSQGHPETSRFEGLMRKATDLHGFLLSALVAKRASDFVADKMVSRARLKKPTGRTKIDRILIEVAAEIRATEGEHFKAITDRVRADYRQQALKIAHIRSNFLHAFQKQLFSELVDVMAPQNQVRDEEPRQVMTLEEVTEMTAKWFPKYSSLSDRPPEPQKPKSTLSAVDRLLGPNFFNPKNAGRKPEPVTKAPPSAKASAPKALHLKHEQPKFPVHAQVRPAARQQSLSPGQAQTQGPLTGMSQVPTKKAAVLRAEVPLKQEVLQKQTGLPSRTQPLASSMERTLPRKEQVPVKTPITPLKAPEQSPPPLPQPIPAENSASDEVEEIEKKRKRKRDQEIASKEAQSAEKSAKLKEEQRARMLIIRRKMLQDKGRGR